MPSKELLDYFIEHTDKRFDEVKVDMEKHRKETNKKLDKLVRYGFVAVILCVALSPAGAKLLEMAPHLFDVAAAFAGGR